MVATEWTSTTTERDLESRLRQVEFRAAELERTIEHRCVRLKSEIETQLLQVISVGLMVVIWVLVIARWLR